MFKLAVCDDDASERDELCALLERYNGQNEPHFSFSVYQNALDLLADIQCGERFDLLLLDIVMPGLSGIEAAREIRSCDCSVKIVFLTSSPDYALESYDVGACRYQLKPVREDRLFAMLSEILAELERADAESLVLRCRDGLTRIPLDSIEYCEVSGKTVCFHLFGGKRLESSGNLERISESLLGHRNFYRPHRSYMINLDFVSSISYQAVTMAGSVKIPLPRGKYAGLRSAFLDWTAQRGWQSV